VVISPRAELEGAVLLVKGEMLDLNLASTFIDGWRKPVDAAIEKDNSIGEDGYLICSISTAGKGKSKTFQRACQLTIEASIVYTAIIVKIRRKVTPSTIVLVKLTTLQLINQTKILIHTVKTDTFIMLEAAEVSENPSEKTYIPTSCGSLLVV